MIPWCERHGVAVVAYSPFGSGDFPQARGALDGDRAAARRDAAPGRARVPRPPAARVRDPEVVQPAHVDELAHAGELVLDEATIAELDAAFPRAPWRGLPML